VTLWHHGGHGRENVRPSSVYLDRVGRAGGSEPLTLHPPIGVAAPKPLAFPSIPKGKPSGPLAR
jgi:hypothetical protein